MFARTANGLALAVIACLLNLPAVTFAQSASDFRLQPIPSATPRASGPVDADAPVVRSTRPDPVPAPVPPPVASASPTASATPAPTRSPAPQPPTSRSAIVRPSPAPSAAASPLSAATGSPTTQPSVAASASPSASPPPVTKPTAEVSAAASEPAPAVAPSAQGSGNWLWPAAIGLVMAVIALAVWGSRRRRAPLVDADDQWPEEIAQTPAAADAGVSEPRWVDQPATSPQPLAAAIPEQKMRSLPAPNQADIAFILDPVRLSATLTSTSLSYRLSVTNNGALSLSNVLVAGGMISAHASLPVEQQLATDGQMLELLHQIESLSPGETAELAGDLRLPLSQITPIRSGKALLFIPLARFRVEAGDTAALATFVIGETPPVAEAALLPFRIDMGPRIWSRVSRRRVDQTLGN